MPKKSVRKAFRPKSRYKSKLKQQRSSSDGDAGDAAIAALQTEGSEVLNIANVDHDYCKNSPQEESEVLSIAKLDHDYCKNAPQEEPEVDCLQDAVQHSDSEAVPPVESEVIVCTLEQIESISELPSSPTVQATNDDALTMFLSAVAKLKAALPKLWIPIASEKGLHLIKVSDECSFVNQRSVTINESGHLTYFVHGKELPVDHEAYHLKTVDISCVENIVCSAVLCVSKFRQFEVCCGVTQLKYKPFWKSCQYGAKDSNVFKEMRYHESFRSHSCALIVSQPKRMCLHCYNLSKRLSKRYKNHRILHGSGKKKTPNKYIPWKNLLTPERQARQERSQKEMKRIKAQNARLRAKLDSMIAEEGITLQDEDESNDFQDLIEESLSNCQDPLQKLFLEQQLQAVKLKDKRSMRWHPMIIRLALRIKMISSAAYKELVNSGVVALPSERTLFDYSHVLDIEEGVCKPIINDVAKRVSELDHEYQRHHVLMFDEVYISQNLVHKKSTGQVIGYCKLSAVQEEILALERKVKEEATGTSQPSPQAPPVAKRILSYLVKGVASNVNGVVASFPVSSLTKEDLLDYTWDVIEACEVKDVRIVALVCDGSPINRSFLDLHPPATKLESGVVIDTVNVYAPHRNIHFFSDMPHLAKTARNCLYNSGKKNCRRMRKNGEYLTWDPIVRLFEEKKNETVTKLHKLNAACVFLNSYSRMKVSYAMRVLSASVSNALQSKKWPGTKELSIFEKN